MILLELIEMRSNSGCDDRFNDIAMTNDHSGFRVRKLGKLMNNIHRPRLHLRNPFAIGEVHAAR